MCTRTQDRQGIPVQSAQEVTSQGTSYLCTRCSHWVHSRCSGLRNVADYHRANGCTACRTPPQPPLAQLRSGYCKLLGSYKSRIKKDASLDVCGKTPHDVKHLFACPAHPTTLIPSDLWSKPVESIREFSYLEENLD